MERGKRAVERRGRNREGSADAFSSSFPLFAERENFMGKKLSAGREGLGSPDPPQGEFYEGREGGVVMSLATLLWPETSGLYRTLLGERMGGMKKGKGGCGKM